MPPVFIPKEGDLSLADKTNLAGIIFIIISCEEEYLLQNVIRHYMFLFLINIILLVIIRLQHKLIKKTCNLLSYLQLSKIIEPSLVSTFIIWLCLTGTGNNQINLFIYLFINQSVTLFLSGSPPPKKNVDPLLITQQFL